MLVAVGEFVLVAVLTGLLLRRYARPRRLPPYAVAVTLLGWFLSFAIVVLLPIDVASTLFHRCLNVAANATGQHVGFCAPPPFPPPFCCVVKATWRSPS